MTKPTFKASGLIDELIKSNKGSEKIFSIDELTKALSNPAMYNNVIIKSTKRNALVIKDGPHLSGGYIDQNGYPRYYDPDHDGEDRFLYIENDIVFSIDPNHIKILPETEFKTICREEDLVIFPPPSFMSTAWKPYANRAVFLLNGDLM